MSKNRSQKQQELQRLTDRLGKMKSVIFSSYHGLKVPEVTALRRTLRNEGIEYQVVKKTLLERALNQVGIPSVLLSSFTSGISLAFGYDDEVLPAKLLSIFQKEHKNIIFQGGIVQGQLYTATQVQALAKLPSRQELLGKMLGSLRSPLSGLCAAANGPLRGLIQVLSAKVSPAAENAK